MFSRFVRFGLALLGLVLSSGAQLAHAGPLPAASVPEPLRAWTPWVLQDHAEAACALLETTTPETRCIWPSRLTIEVADKGARFRQSWHADARSWVSLPGDAKRWPDEVFLDKKRAVVIARAGVPSVEITPGDHLIEGSFAWDAPPESLQIPKDTGLLALSIRGVDVPVPSREDSGVVWLSREGNKEEGERLDIVVHRKITDGVPLLISTRLELNVAGKSREVLLGKALPAGFVPLSLEAPIPARVEPDSRLRVQVRPGTFVITLVARSEQVTNDLGRPAPDGPWREGEEIWVFEAKPQLRLVTVEGVPSIDPQQTSLPAEWKSLPAYPMKPSDRLRLVERRRGDADPPPDQLTLERSLWLDFDGKGYTVNDRIVGQLARDGRIEMAPPTTLGRVSVRTTDRFITRLGDAGKTGVELRRGPLSLTADSRIEGAVSDIPAVGWAHDFHKVSTALYLPPGFRLFHASGVDDVPSTWIRHWSLLELFVALVASLAIGRLYGIPWGVLSLALFALSFPETGAPKWIWLAVLASEALVRGLAKTRLAFALQAVRFAALVSLILVTVPFLVGHVRQGMYPVLSNPDAMLGNGAPAQSGEESDESDALRLPKAANIPAAPAASSMAPPADKEIAPSKPRSAAPKGTGFGMFGASSADGRSYEAEAADPNAMVQTGPGLPRWTWTRVDLVWSGPVERGQRVHLSYWTPSVNRALAFLRAILLVVLVLRVLPWIAARGPAWWRRVPAAGAVLLMTLLPSSARAEMPDQATLDKLGERLTRRPDCSPSCSSTQRLLVEASGDVLRLRLAIDAAAHTAVPLPGGAVPWGDVLVDGKAASALSRDDGSLWVALEPGSHVVVLQARLRGRESLQLALRQKPHRVETQLEGWRMEGLHEDGLADDTLQLTRVKRAETDGQALAPGALPPFVNIARTLQIGQTWVVETKVTRASPLGAAIVIEVPLLPRESVTTADTRVVGGKVLVNLGPQVKEVAWRSVLEPTTPIQLSATKGIAAIEIWRVDVSPIWHATFTGLPFVHFATETEARLPEMRPWPGEQVRVDVVRPGGVPGQTLTIDTSTLAVTPGARATEVVLTLSLRSSRGGEHTITLPAGSHLSKVTINSASQPVRQDGVKVTLPIVPGAQQVVVSFRLDTGWTAMFHTPAVDLGAPSVNTTVTVEGTASRWLLGMGGLPAGPVVLFWSLLLVLSCIAYALGRSRWTPLRFPSWLLLSIGLSQVSVVSAALVVGWLFFLGYRSERPDLRWEMFNLRQVVIAVWTLVALVTLGVAVHHGLLGTPEMQVQGNGSASHSLRWFVDRSANTPRSAWIVSVPVLVYRGAMLLWALWVAYAVLSWLRWGWEAFGVGGMWRGVWTGPAPGQTLRGAVTEVEEKETPRGGSGPTGPA